ncbi:hypothetical protein PCA31118_05391 [Pandoraea captiosa]|uniref:Uncharacterized protein n=1 Tax=Pandoraea captiosa TaxID=2508302 RepID=A0A5E5AVF9_9BURK|nr:hypothetical protein [Pandoraea captiosa]VVE77097.1 hypothetical protein PCA31118_05391 [Pandoraea captiosa]
MTAKGSKRIGFLGSIIPGTAVTLLWAAPLMLLFAFMLYDPGQPGEITRLVGGISVSLIFGAWMARDAGYFDR